MSAKVFQQYFCSSYQKDYKQSHKATDINLNLLSKIIPTHVSNNVRSDWAKL